MSQTQQQEQLDMTKVKEFIHYTGLKVTGKFRLD